MLKLLFPIVFFLFSFPDVLSDIRINEVMYDPSCSDSFCEYIEIYNNDSDSINITGWTIGDSNTNDTLEDSSGTGSGFIIPGFSFAIITDQDSRVHNNYEIPDNIIWVYTDDTAIGDGLSNSETINLYNENSILVDTITYNEATNGNSLNLINETWQQASSTPGLNNTNNETISDFSKLSITEFLPNPAGDDSAAMPNGEWLELYNSGSEKIDLFSFELYDNVGSEADIVISNTSTLSGTIIQPNSYKLIYTNGVSGFLNNGGIEKITLKDVYGNILDEVTYSDSDEGVSWSLVEDKWQKSVPTAGYSNEDNKTSSQSELRIDEIYDLGNDKKAEWGDAIRVKIFAYKGNTEEEVVWMWIEGDGTRITKKSKFNLYNKFQNTTLTYPLMIPENCDDEFSNGNYKVIVQGFNTVDEKTLEIRDKPLCKNSDRPPRVKNLEYSIKQIPEQIVPERPFVTEVILKNNNDEDLNLDVWSYAYSGKKKYVQSEELENLQKILLKPDEEKIIELENALPNTDKEILNFKVKIKKENNKTPYELTEKIVIKKEEIQKEKVKEKASATFKNPITGYTVYEGTNIKAQRSAIFFFNGLLAALLVSLLIKAWNSQLRQ